jgi:hypothetical protein
MEPHATGLEVRIRYEIGHILGEVFDLDRALEKYLSLLGASSSMTQGLIILKDLESDSPLIRASYGFMPGEAEPPKGPHPHYSPFREIPFYIDRSPRAGKTKRKRCIF